MNDDEIPTKIPIINENEAIIPAIDWCSMDTDLGAYTIASELNKPDVQANKATPSA